MAFTIVRNLINKFTHTHRPPACSGPFGLVPQELLDLIIAYLFNDKATLLSCALVHPSWNSISRHHLASLTLRISSPSRAKELVKLLHSSRQTLSSSITGITLVGDVPFDNISANAKSPRARSYDKLLNVFRARRVTLCSGTVENDPSVVRILAQYFPDLTELKVACASYQDLTSFMRALAGSFPRLSELSIKLAPGGLDLPGASLSGLLNLRLSMPCLRSLRVVGWNNDLVRWLGDNVSGTLERLELESSSVMSTCHFAEATLLIQRNKETLKDVRLSYVKRNVVFDLSKLLRLENLEVTSGMGDMEMALDGWRLPRTLTRVVLRNAALLVEPRLVGHCVGRYIGFIVFGESRGYEWIGGNSAGWVEVTENADEGCSAQCGPLAGWALRCGV
ncbi:hypothetical protein CPB85DRAFT_1250318 [Mucidula mucida]|nr:hypothetical protein CPB85DRAFT_1250318 [Mucidula mucida]